MSDLTSAGFDSGGRRVKAVLTAVFVVAVGLALMAALWFYVKRDTSPAPRQVREVTILKIVPLPPPPPPPPPPEPQKQQEIEQPKVTQQEMKEEKPEDVPQKPKEEPKDSPKSAKDDGPPPNPLMGVSNNLGPPDNFGGVQGIGGLGTGWGNGGGGGGSRFGWYASMVQSEIESALHRNEKTRRAVVQNKIRLWADGAGHISRVQLTASTGDSELDAAIRDVLGGLQLREPPPKDMPMPITTRVIMRRPS